MPEIADLPLTSPQVGDGFIVRRGTSPALVELPDFSGGSAPHTHPIVDVVGLQTALDGKQASGSYASSVHTHVISDTTGLQTALDGKANVLGVDDNYVTDAEKTKLSLLSGTNTGDQTSIVGVSGTKAQFNTAVTDGDFLYVGDAPPTDLAYTASTRLLTSSTGTDVTLPLVTTSDAGLAPASGGGTTNFLRADGTWAAPAGGGGGGASPIISWMI